jgi:hypothetical protein
LAILKVKQLSPELKEMEDIIVLVNYIEEDLSNSAGDALFEGRTQDEDTYDTRCAS